MKFVRSNFIVDQNLILEEKYLSQASRATSKEEMNVDLTPKRQRDFRTFFSVFKLILHIYDFSL